MSTKKQLYALALVMEHLEAKAKEARARYEDALGTTKIEYELWQHSTSGPNYEFHWRSKSDSPRLKWNRRSRYYAKESDALLDLVNGTIKIESE